MPKPLIPMKEPVLPTEWMTVWAW